MKRFIASYIGIGFFMSLLLSCSTDSPSTGGGGTPLPVDPPITYTDNELMDMVQRETFKYFWDYAESNSKLARERYHTDDPSFDQNVVAIGGSGFGLMSILVGIERGYVTRGAAVSRLQTAMTFLEKADRFHGAWPHWLYGDTGRVKPFDNEDNGGDLVETSFLCQGLICIREYFKNGNAEEKALAAKADDLWKGVDWQWYTKEGTENALYWHWSPNYGWVKNFKLRGYMETLITYVMAAASPTHTIEPIVYNDGWAELGGIKNPNSQFGIPIIFKYGGGTSSVGPMFFSHYSYVGLNPKGLTDQYANYWDATRNHALIMHQYSISNPGNFNGYNAKVWGLTSSYSRNPDGSLTYYAHAPYNDKGVIAPTAALASMPYTPTESMKFLRYLYEEKKSTLVGVAGPYDAFSPHYNWVTKNYLAIDQGPIVVMIENHRTGLLWNLFMNAPEVKSGLLKLGFHSAEYGF